MVDILALGLIHDEQQIERAVAKSVDAGEPSKQHVLNCPSRLGELKRPKRLKAPPALKLVTEPLADTARYLKLRRTLHEP